MGNSLSWDCENSVDRVVFRRYLVNQGAHDLHILRFRSTHQYYRTVVYEPNRTIGDGDIWQTPVSHFDSQTFTHCTFNGQQEHTIQTSKSQKLMYLRHQSGLFLSLSPPPYYFFPPCFATIWAQTQGFITFSPLVSQHLETRGGKSNKIRADNI